MILQQQLACCRPRRASWSVTWTRGRCLGRRRPRRGRTLLRRWRRRGRARSRSGSWSGGPSWASGGGRTVLLFTVGDHNKYLYPLFAGISHLITAWGWDLRSRSVVMTSDVWQNALLAITISLYWAHKGNTVLKRVKKPFWQAVYLMNLQSSPRKTYIGFKWMYKANFFPK